MEVYPAEVSVRKVEDIPEALWGNRVCPSTISDLNQKIFERVEAWRNSALEQEYPYVFVDGIWLKRTWGGEVETVSVLVALGVNREGYREALGVAEGSREDRESWRGFLRYLKDRGLERVRLLVSDKSLGLLEHGTNIIRTPAGSAAQSLFTGKGIVSRPGAKSRKWARCSRLSMLRKTGSRRAEKQRR